MKKKIIFGYIGHSAVAAYFIENMRQCKFSVVSIGDDAEPFKYRTFADRVHNFFRKVFLNDRTFKHALAEKYKAGRIIERLAEMEEIADYAVIIRPDVFPCRFIKLLKKKAREKVAYQWDGFSRFPGSEKFIKYFDRFFVFDPEDVCAKKATRYITNFYFDIKRLLVNNEPQKNTLYFVGDHFKNRTDALLDLLEYVEGTGLIGAFYLFFPNLPESVAYKDVPSIHILDKKISYEENLKMVKQCAVVVDIINNIHTGLSFRVFEALCYDKKLISNNPSIEHFDFYHPNNIFIYNENDFDPAEFTAFLKRPYMKVEDSIKQKYSFTNWIHYVLDLPPYTKINLPERLQQSI